MNKDEFLKKWDYQIPIIESLEAIPDDPNDDSGFNLLWRMFIDALSVIKEASQSQERVG